MNKKLKTIIIVCTLMIATLLIADSILSEKYVMPVLSERTKIFNEGDINDVREFLQKQNSSVEMDNYYALINRNRADILEMMFKEFKLNPDYNFKYKYATPLFGAAKELKPEVVKILIEYGADVNYQDPYGMTPLIAAAYTTHEYENPASFEITKMLVEAGAIINVVTKYGKRAMAGALYLHEDLERFKYLVESGGDINQVDKDGLGYMFHCNTIECFKYFLSMGSDINSTINDGSNILQNSLYVKTSIEETKTLLALGADVCHKDNAGDTVLNYVERQGTGPHLHKEKPDAYKRMIENNRATKTYKYLEKKYQEDCM